MGNLLSTVNKHWNPFALDEVLHPVLEMLQSYAMIFIKISGKALIDEVDMLRILLCLIMIVGKCQGPAQDEVIAKLRHAFLEVAKEYKTFTDEEKNKVCKYLMSEL